jgi:hypothetical protein
LTNLHNKKGDRRKRAPQEALHTAAVKVGSYKPMKVFQGNMNLNKSKKPLDVSI